MTDFDELARDDRRVDDGVREVLKFKPVQINIFDFCLSVEMFMNTVLYFVRYLLDISYYSVKLINYRLFECHYACLSVCRSPLNVLMLFVIFLIQYFFDNVPTQKILLKEIPNLTKLICSVPACRDRKH
jgi:hypothetical protein